MTSSLANANSATHLRVVVVALVAGILVVLTGIAAHVTSGKATRLTEPQREAQPTTAPPPPFSSKIVLA